MQPISDFSAILEQTSLIDDFIELVQIDTQSDDKADRWPSTEGQDKGLSVVRDKLLALGLEDAEIDENGYLFATLPATVKDTAIIGLLAHIDTAPDFSGASVKPVLHNNYDGKKIKLSGDVVIDPEQSPELSHCKGDIIITADGTTLLGADDKAGVAEILAAVRYLVDHPEINRPTLRIGITPDEEIGKGAERFDVERFGATAAYTLDGGFLGEVNGETFSADGVKVTFQGVAVHPGYAKDKLVNALRWAARFIDDLPQGEAPETTVGRQGFYHPTRISGNASEATVEMILRDFDLAPLKERGTFLNVLADRYREEEPRLKVEVEVSETYRNMAYWLTERPEVFERLLTAVKDAGIEPINKPVRGGTDGSGLTAKGLPTPNIFAGGVNFHGPREWVSTRVMALSVCTVLNLVQRWAETV